MGFRFSAFAASVLAASAIFAMPAQAFSALAVQDVDEAPSAEQIAEMIQAAIDALPEDATQEEIEEAIREVLAMIDADPVTIAVALAIVARNNPDNPAIVNAVQAVAASNEAATRGQGQGSGSNTPPTGGTSGGNSDY